MKPVNESTLKAAIDRIETTRRNLGDISMQEEWNLEVYKKLLAELNAEVIGYVAWHKTNSHFGSYLYSNPNWVNDADYEVLPARLK